MARIMLTTGSCPSCGRDVPRSIGMRHGATSEIYHCPQHGPRDASPHGMTLAAWATPTVTMADLRGMLDTVSPPLAGLDWVI